MKYEPEFSNKRRSVRGGPVKESLWVTMPDGTNVNIWDIKPELLTSETKDAIRMAFERGILAGIELCKPKPHSWAMGEDRWK